MVNQTPVREILTEKQFIRIVNRMPLRNFARNIYDEMVVAWAQRGEVIEDGAGHEPGSAWTFAMVHYRGEYGIGFSKRNPNYTYSAGATGLTIATSRGIHDLFRGQVRGQYLVTAPEADPIAPEVISLLDGIRKDIDVTLYGTEEEPDDLWGI